MCMVVPGHFKLPVFYLFQRAGALAKSNPNWSQWHCHVDTSILRSKDCSQLETVERIGYRRKSNDTGAGFECDLSCSWRIEWDHVSPSLSFCEEPSKKHVHTVYPVGYPSKFPDVHVHGTTVFLWEAEAKGFWLTRWICRFYRKKSSKIQHTPLAPYNHDWQSPWLTTKTAHYSESNWNAKYVSGRDSLAPVGCLWFTLEHAVQICSVTAYIDHKVHWTGYIQTGRLPGPMLLYIFINNSNTGCNRT